MILQQNLWHRKLCRHLDNHMHCNLLNHVNYEGACIIFFATISVTFFSLRISDITRATLLHIARPSDVFTTSPILAHSNTLEAQFYGLILFSSQFYKIHLVPDIITMTSTPPFSSFTYSYLTKEYDNSTPGNSYMFFAVEDIYNLTRVAGIATYIPISILDTRYSNIMLSTRSAASMLPP